MHNKKIKTLEQIHFDATKLSVLLRTLHAALPDDPIDSVTDTRFIVKWACQLATELSNDVDLLDLSLHGAGIRSGEGANE